MTKISSGTTQNLLAQ